MKIGWMRRRIFAAIEPITRAIGKIHAPYTHRRIRALDYFVIAKAVEPGMVLLSHTRGEATNLFIPGFFTHAAIVAAGGSEVIEATGEGVHRTHLIDFCMTKDAIAVMQHKSLSGYVAAGRAASAVGAPYDYYFESGVKALYCAELVKVAYDQRPAWLRANVLGEEVLTPQEIYDGADWRCVFESR